MKLTFKRDYVKGLESHTLTAHNGVFDPSCRACKEIQEKIDSPKPESKLNIRNIKISFHVNGKNSTSLCSRGAHRRCSGKHTRKHGLPGEKCTCSCHAKECDFDESKVISMLSKTRTRIY